MPVYDELCSSIMERNWSLLINILKPKDFPRDAQGNLVHRNILAKIAETLTTPEPDIPNNVKICILKCFVNSCDGYMHEEFPEDLKDDKSSHDCCHKLYASLTFPNNAKTATESFPYDGIIQWTVNYILTNVDFSEEYGDRSEILRLSLQFICNLLGIALQNKKVPALLNSDDFKSAIVTLVTSKHARISRLACAIVHNTLNGSSESHYELQMQSLVERLIEADKLGICSAGESLTILLQRPRWLESIYEDLSIRSKLYLLEMICHKVDESLYSQSDQEASTNFPSDLVQFLSERFKRKSDLILKTVDSYLDGLEPAEIPLLLEIIGKISSRDSQECHLLRNDKSLMINCIFLLKSLHMAGKASDNHFTPLQKLSAVAPCNQELQSVGENIQNHPAFGFKAGLIKAIGNLAHQHKENQKLVRETDAIPLLLDCCNIDARNPSVIIQWAILALRNVCEGSPENQEIIRNCNRVGIIDNEMIKEMGIKLQESKDGKAIGIVPLTRNK